MLKTRLHRVEVAVKRRLCSLESTVADLKTTSIESLEHVKKNGGMCAPMEISSSKYGGKSSSTPFDEDSFSRLREKWRRISKPESYAAVELAVLETAPETVVVFFVYLTYFSDAATGFSKRLAQDASKLP